MTAPQFPSPRGESERSMWPKRHSAHGISKQHASDTGRGQSRQDPGEQGRQRDLGDVTGTARGDLRQHTDLCTEGANVSEALRFESQLRIIF